ncbi:MAG: MMPL family transporter, partial [Crenarchaeota archaeon]|nr:MMPL family transporter [Thermoproteota archaeon]
ENMIYNPQLFNLGQDFIATFNALAYNETATYLQQIDPEAYEQYTVHLLNAFNNAWLQSWQNTPTQQYTVLQRAIVASNQANQIYINNFLATNQTAKTFATTLTNTLTLTDYLTNTQTQNNQKLQKFAVEYVSQSGNASVEFVDAAYDVNSNPSHETLAVLAKAIILNPEIYNMGQNFISTFNEVAYNQTVTYLSDIDEESFEQYTSYLLDLFNESWVQTFQNPNSLNLSVEQRATLAIEQASVQYINLHMDENAEFGIAISQIFSLQDFIANNTDQISQKLDDFAVSYITNQSGLSSTFINAIFDLGRNYEQVELNNLAGKIVCNPENYDLIEQLISGVNSLVSQSKDVTLISIGLTNSNSDTLAIVREIIKSELLENSGDIKSALVTGRTALNSDFGDSATQDLDFILPVTIVLLIAATGLFFRSIITPLVTLGTIGVGLGISQIFIVLVGTYVNKVDFMIPTILLTVLLGVGTDYSIFIIARHREELVNGLSVKEAILKAITWAGESIVTSGTTVIISFLGLAITTMVLLQTLGIIVGVSVIVALLVSLTLVPALAVILGSKLFWPNSGERFQKYADKIRKTNHKKSGYFARSGTFSVKHAKVIIILAILITVPMLYVCDTSTPTYNFLGGASKDLESIKAM